MFFRMLWRDLRDKKGMNLILFLFMIAASVLVFVSAAQVYASITGGTRTKTACRVADGALFCPAGSNTRESGRPKLEQALQDDEEVLSFVRQERVILKTMGIDFEHFDEAGSDAFLDKRFYLSPEQTDANLVYDLQDAPFYLHNGQVAVPLSVRILTGAQIGDKLRITTDMGNIYELEIAQFYKRYDRYNRLIVTQADFDRLCEDFPVRQDVYQIKLREPSEYAMLKLYERMYEQTLMLLGVTFYNTQSMEDTYSSIIAIFLVLISIFMIVLIFMTIRFTMVAALKDEEKGIGMMRAIGVDSFRFRWLFAAKYIAFAVIGGVIGAVIGFPLSKRMLLEFCPNTMSPPNAVLFLIGACAVVLIAAMMILFSLSVMRRIRRISVMDAIHCENRGERFGKASPLLLHRRKRMPVPLYLALSDILTRLKRYLFLIISYTLGGAILLLVVTLHGSVMNTSYLHYDLISQLDFDLDLSEAQMKPYDERYRYENIPFWQQINDELAEAGIPASAKLYYLDARQMQFHDMQIGHCAFVYGMPEPEILIYREGVPPSKANECAVSTYTADQYGITLGSVIDIYPYFSEEEQPEPEQFVVTGLVNYIEQGDPLVLTGIEYMPEYYDEYPSVRYATTINAEDKEAVFAQLCEHFGASHVETPEQFLEYYMGEFATILRTIMYVIVPVVLIVLALITVLYLQIFLGEDTAEIALLRALGFRDSTILASQLLRMLLLITGSILAAILLTKTAGLALIRLLMGLYVGLSGFTFEPLWIFTCVMMPLLLLAVVLIPTLLQGIRIRRIDIREISEE